VEQNIINLLQPLKRLSQTFSKVDIFYVTDFAPLFLKVDIFYVTDFAPLFLKVDKVDIFM
jgi:hypothetical protein